MLQYLFNIRNESVTVATFLVIINAHRNKLIDAFDLVAHFDIILHQVGPEFVSKGLLERLIELTESDAPELFPICSWMAMNVGSRGMRQMLTGVRPSPRLASGEFWCVWAVVGMYRSDAKLQRSITRFLIRCSSNSFAILFATIEIVGRALREDPEAMVCILVAEFGKMLLRDDTNCIIDDVLSYFDILKHFLFFRSETVNSKPLINLYERSPFTTTPTLTKPKQTSPKRSPKKDGRQKARRSLNVRAMILEEPNRYSPALAEQAWSVLNPEHPHQQSFRSKRTSLMVPSRRRLDCDECPSTEVPIVSMMQSQLDERFSSIARGEISFRFGLRFNGQGRWADAQLGEQALRVFEKFCDARAAEVIVVVCAFLLHTEVDFDFVCSALAKVDLHSEQLSSALSLLCLHSRLVRKHVFSQAFPESGVFEFFQQFESRLSSGPLRLLKHLLKFQEQNSTTAFDIFGLVNEDIVALSSTFMAGRSTGDTLNVLLERVVQVLAPFDCRPCALAEVASDAVATRAALQA
jgi:hypothetical protein